MPKNERPTVRTQLIKYSEVRPGDQIFTNGKDNHMHRKLSFQEIEKVKSAESYESKGNGILVLITFESGNSSLGFVNRILEKIIN